MYAPYLTHVRLSPPAHIVLNGLGVSPVSLSFFPYLLVPHTIPTSLHLFFLLPVTLFFFFPTHMLSATTLPNPSLFFFMPSFFLPSLSFPTHASHSPFLSFSPFLLPHFSPTTLSSHHFNPLFCPPFLSSSYTISTPPVPVWVNLCVYMHIFVTWYWEIFFLSSLSRSFIELMNYYYYY